MCYFITYFLAIFLVFSDTFLIVSFPFLITKFLHASLISLISRQLQETVIVIEQPGQPGNLFLLLVLILRTPSVPKGRLFPCPTFPYYPTWDMLMQWERGLGRVCCERLWMPIQRLCTLGAVEHRDHVTPGSSPSNWAHGARVPGKACLRGVGWLLGIW